MSDMSDYQPGTAYIVLSREDFKDPNRFDAYVRFMRWKKGTTALTIPIDDRYRGFERKYSEEQG